MPLPAQKFRESVLQILYSMRFEVEGADIISLMMEKLKTTRKEMIKAYERAEKIGEKKETINSFIESASSEYRLERISGVELNILQLGVYELLFDDLIPEKVAIKEAIRLCRKFGTSESAQFVNAILDVIYKKQTGPSADRDQPVPV